jgi:hypothetical protein
MVTLPLRGEHTQKKLLHQVFMLLLMNIVQAEN